MNIDPSLIDFNLQVRSMGGGGTKLVNLVPDRNDFKLKTEIKYEPTSIGPYSVTLNAANNTIFFNGRQWGYNIYNTNNPQLSTPTGATFACWVWSNNLDQHPEKYGDMHYSIDGGAGIWLYNTKDWSSTRIPKVPVNEWYYQTAVISNGYLYFFVNGSLYGTVTQSVDPQVSYDKLNFWFTINGDQVYYKDVVAVRTPLWTSNFTPPEFNTPLLDLDPSLEITKNMLIPYPFDDMLKVY